MAAHLIFLSLYELTQQTYMSIHLIHGQCLKRGGPIKTNKQTHLEGDWTNIFFTFNTGQ